MAELITFSCTNCQHVLKIGAEKAGRKAKCPKCQQPLTVPSSTGAVAPAHKKESDEVITGYGFMDEPVHVAPKVDLTKPIGHTGEEDDEDDEDRPAKEGTGPKAQKREKAVKKRTLLDAELWQPVKLGLKIITYGFGIWIFTLVLPMILYAIIAFQVYIPMLTGDADGQLKGQYASFAGRFEANRNEPESPEYLSKSAFAVGLVTGPDLLGAGIWFYRITTVFVLIMSITFLVGYAIALSIPDRFGSKGLLRALLSVVGVNLICQLVFKLLPLTGVMDFTLLMYVTPELPQVDANIERFSPLAAFWSHSPFWEFFFALILQLLSITAPVLYAAFLRTIALAMKNDIFEGTTKSMLQLAVSVAFIQIAYYLVACTGTSEVIVNVLRIVYGMGQAFLLGMLIWFLLVTTRVPAMIDKELD